MDSISGDDSNNGKKIRNVLIDHVLCFKSISRGAVEISDGTDFITARNIYAEDAVYGVDIQDHKSANQQNTNVTVIGALIRRCKYGVVTRNNDFNHTRLTLSDIIIEDCIEPIKISNTSHVIIGDIQVIDNKSNKPAVQFKNCKYVHADKFHISSSTGLGIIMQVTNTDFFHFSNSFIDNSRSEAKQNILIEYKDEKHYKSLVMRDIIFTNKHDSIPVNTNLPDQLDDCTIENTNAKVFKK